jgi:hypothetical protein
MRYERAKFENEDIRALIANGILTVEQAMQCDHEQLKTFKSETIGVLIAERVLTVEQAMQFRALQRRIFESEAILVFIVNRILTVEQAIQLTGEQLRTFENEIIRALIIDQTFTVEQAMRLGYYQCITFESEAICALIANDILTIEQAMQLSPMQRDTFENESIRTLLTNGSLTAAQVMQFNDNQRAIFRNAAICQLIVNGVLPIDQAIQFDGNQRATFERSVIRGLVVDGILTVEQAMELGPNHRVALEDEQTIQRLRNGQLTFDQFMGQTRRAQATPVVTPVINDTQSTHTASVHKSVSESATRLFDRYHSRITGGGLEETIRRIQIFGQSLLPTSVVNRAAKNCILRITNPGYVFTDGGSGITTRELLALVFLAINDNDQRRGSLENARGHFVQALYEIQRGYNLSETGEDQGGDDRPICSPGTFNKLIERLNGVHPDCEIQFVTGETATLKLPIVVREEAMNYLTTLSKVSTAEGRAEFVALMGRVKEEGVEVIWDQIQGHVADRMFDEFGRLYPLGKTNFAFTSFIEAGQSTELSNLDVLLQTT